MRTHKKVQTRKRAPRPTRIFHMTEAVKKQWLRVARVIEKNADAYDQSTYGDCDFKPEDNLKPRCGAPACLAGFFYAYSPLKMRGDDAAYCVLNTLAPVNKKDERDEEAEAGVYHLTNGNGCAWPEPFASQFDAAELARDRKALAKVAAARVRYLVKYGA